MALLGLTGNVALTPSEVAFEVPAGGAPRETSILVSNRGGQPRYFTVTVEQGRTLDPTMLRIFPDQFVVPPNESVRFTVEVVGAPEKDSVSGIILLKEIAVENTQSQGSTLEVQLLISLPAHIALENTAPDIHAAFSEGQCDAITVVNRGRRYAYLSDYLFRDAGGELISREQLISQLEGNSLILPSGTRQISLAQTSEACGVVEVSKRDVRQR